MELRYDIVVKISSTPIVGALSQVGHATQKNRRFECNSSQLFEGKVSRCN